MNYIDNSQIFDDSFAKNKKNLKQKKRNISLKKKNDFKNSPYVKNFVKNDELRKERLKLLNFNIKNNLISNPEI